MQLVFGARELDRVVSDAEKLLVSYRDDDGYPYLEYRTTSPNSHIVPEDLAVTLLVNSRATGKAFKSIEKYGPTLSLARLPDKPLEGTTQAERTTVAAVIAEVANWPGFATSIATKVLHKKKPALIPILDNQAIFGAYLNRYWPQRNSSQDSVKDQDRIEQALGWMTYDLTRDENTQIWARMRVIEPARTLVQLFDSVWWMYFRKTEPLRTNAKHPAGKGRQSP
jgi:hypothetical protein